MERLVRDCFRSGGYVFAGKAEDVARKHGNARVARLASNENPEPPAPAAVEQGTAALRQANRYPDERVEVLTEALRRHYGNYPFVTGVGMDGVIETVIRVLVSPGERVAIATPTFSFYSLAATAQGADIVAVPREPDFSVDPDTVIRKAKNAKVTFLCSPNNPTGNVTPVRDVGTILQGIEGVLFLDCAYVEFSTADYLPLLKEYDNLVIGRTFSKVHSLAGLRVGYAFVPSWLQPYYCRAGTPFTVNSVSSAAAAAALDDVAHAERYIAAVRHWRERFAREVQYPVLPSDANFVLVDVAPRTGDEMVADLAGKGVIVRSCRSFSGLPDHYIRVSVGDSWENERFIQSINAV